MNELKEIRENLAKIQGERDAIGDAYDVGGSQYPRVGQYRRPSDVFRRYKVTWSEGGPQKPATPSDYALIEGEVVSSDV